MCAALMAKQPCCHEREMIYKYGSVSGCWGHVCFLALLFLVSSWASPRDGLKHLRQLRCLSWKRNCHRPTCKSDVIAFGVVIQLRETSTDFHI